MNISFQIYDIEVKTKRKRRNDNMLGEKNVENLGKTLKSIRTYEKKRNDVINGLLTMAINRIFTKTENRRWKVQQVTG